MIKSPLVSNSQSILSEAETEELSASQPVQVPPSSSLQLFTQQSSPNYTLFPLLFSLSSLSENRITQENKDSYNLCSSQMIASQVSLAEQKDSVSSSGNNQKDIGDDDFDLYHYIFGPDSSPVP